MKWDEFIEKAGWEKNRLVEGFASSLYELEKKEGRPVYYFEVLYYLNKKTNAGGLSENLRGYLGNCRKRARKYCIGSISVGDVQNSYNAAVRSLGRGKRMESAEEFRKAMGLTEKIEGIKQKIKDKVENWGSLDIKISFPENEPLHYAKWKGVEKGTVFENMKIGEEIVGKTETTVTYQFVRWLLRPANNRTSYLHLK